MSARVKQRVFEILNVQKTGDVAGTAVKLFLVVLISLNVLAVIVETVESINQRYALAFDIFEYISISLFSIEYGLRVWTCGIDPKFESPVYGRLRFVVTPLPLVDLFAILPSLIPFLIPVDLRFLRALRLLRVLRILKFGRYSDSIALLGRVFAARAGDLTIALFALFILLVLSSSLMYYVENKAQPEAFSSIPATMWWGVVTLTTIGYGDVYPVTHWGKFLGGIIGILGIGLFALPAGIVASGFTEALSKRENKLMSCPHCGKKIGETTPEASGHDA